MFSLLLTTYTLLDNVDVSANGPSQRRRSIEPPPSEGDNESVGQDSTDSGLGSLILIILAMLFISGVIGFSWLKFGRAKKKQ